MAIQCADTETLVHTYLDRELAESDANMLQDHLAGCSSCSRLAAEEARMHAQLREKLAPPPAPAHLRARVLDALDAQDFMVRKRTTSRWTWSLPATASLAAVAALFFFMVSQKGPNPDTVVAQDAVRQHVRRLPIEVSGSSAPLFVHEHFSLDAQLPRFSDVATRMLGARLSHLDGRDAVQVFYETRMGNRLYDVSLLIANASAIGPCRGTSVDFGGRQVCVSQNNGFHIAIHKSDDGFAYIFISEMDDATMLDFVKTSDLLLRAARPRDR